jgi:hypothetical protein
MSLNPNGEIRRSTRLAGNPPPNFEQTTPIPPMPTMAEMPPPMPVPTNTTPSNQSQHSSALLSESNNTYTNNSNYQPSQNNHDGHQYYNQSSNAPYQYRSNTIPPNHKSNGPYSTNIAQPPINHVRGLNIIPDFLPYHYPYNNHIQPTHVPHTPSAYPPPPPVNNQQQYEQQLLEMRQQMQQEHQKQLRDLENRFEQRLHQNTVALSQTLATTLGDQLKSHFQQIDQPIKSSDSTPTPNLIDFETPVPIPTATTTTSEPKVTIPSTPTTNKTTTSNTDPTATLTKLLLASKEPKLYYQSYKPNNDYDNWKYMCVLKTHKHSAHKDLTAKDSDGNLIFNPHMTDEQSSTLFMLTMESLGAHADKLSIDMQKADGLKLWSLLDRSNLDIDTDVTNQESLSHQFESLRRKQNEDYESFALRFVKKIKELRYNEVPVTTDKKRLAFKLLRGLNEPVINSRICMELRAKPEWYINITLPEIASKAKKYMKHHNSLQVPTNQQNKPSPPTSTPKAPPQKPSNSSKQGTND